jgi:hypothetical protein
MKKYSLAFLALATALAISPGAFANSLIDINGGDTLAIADGAQSIGPLSPDVFNVKLHTSANLLTGTTSGVTSGVFATEFDSHAVVSVITSVLSLTIGETFSTPLDLFSVTENGKSANVFITSVAGSVGDAYTYAKSGYADGLGYILLSNGDEQAASWSLAYSKNTSGQISYSANATLIPENIVTPEPSSILLLGAGVLGLAFVAFRKTRPTGVIQAM